MRHTAVFKLATLTFFAVVGSSSAVGSPVIFNVTNTVAIESSPVWITAGVTDVVALASVTLAYTTNATPILTNTVFLETMGTNLNGVSPWTGTGCDNAWIVNYNGSNPFSQVTNSNYGGNPCVLQFAKGTTSLVDSMITNVSSINATGSAGYVEFYLKTANLTPNTGWAFLVNAGSGFVPRLSDLSGTVHTWQLYHYDLQANELVTNLTLGFQFAGGATTNKIFLDQISVKVITGGGSWINTAMYDDGLHNDGAAGDGLYGGQIPASPAGTSVSYFLTASNGAGLSATNPAVAPYSSYNYTVAPAVIYDLMIGRPTDSSIAVNVLANQNLQVYFQYGTQSGIYPSQTVTSTIANGVPNALTIDQLQANQRYYYRMAYSTNGGASFKLGTEHSFTTQRARGSTFTFDIDADPHYGDYGIGNSGGTVDMVWKQTYTNILTDQPDFFIDLGDTFMGEKLFTYYGVTNALTQPSLIHDCADARSRFFSIIGHSVPLFLVNGNHDPELGWMLTNSVPHANPGVWGASARDQYYACPVPGGFYSGATNIDYYQQQPRDGYYAFEWGDALFVMLDPFWYSNQGVTKSSNPWAWTLGTNQYYWLKSTLENSTARFKFVFAHHLIGGSWDTQARGGLEFSPYFEWGGLNTNGTSGFAANRPGWPMPIRDLLLTNHVQVFFHGHDHLYCKQDYYATGVTNGSPDLIYQEVPQPSHYPYDSYSYATGTNFGYNYQTGVFYGSSGHLRVTVAPTNVTVDYVRSYSPAYPPTASGPGITNRMVSYSYNVPATGLLNGSIAANNLVLQWSSQSSLNYIVRWSSDLINWSNVPVGQTNAWKDTNTIPTVPKRFYRLMW